jgi:hypothetical protein
MIGAVELLKRRPGSWLVADHLSGPLLVESVQHAFTPSHASKFGGKDRHRNSLKDTVRESFPLFTKSLILLGAVIPLRFAKIKHLSFPNPEKRPTEM